MGQFFNGWQRKWGMALLAVSLLFAGAWLRSFLVEDFVEFPFSDDSVSGLETEDQSLIVYWFSNSADDIDETIDPVLDAPAMVDSTGSSTDSDVASAHTEPIDEPASALDGVNSAEEWSVVGGPSSVRTHTTVISCGFSSPKPLFKVWFGSIVIPMTVVSACLLLWNRRHSV